jgi:hypothetical protein
LLPQHAAAAATDSKTHYSYFVFDRNCYHVATLSAATKPTGEPGGVRVRVFSITTMQSVSYLHTFTDLDMDGRTGGATRPCREQIKQFMTRMALLKLSAE